MVRLDRRGRQGEEEGRWGRAGQGRGHDGGRVRPTGGINHWHLLSLSHLGDYEPGCVSPQPCAAHHVPRETPSTAQKGASPRTCGLKSQLMAFSV